jgi:excisionase family DNA binding protein
MTTLAQKIAKMEDETDVKVEEASRAAALSITNIVAVYALDFVHKTKVKVVLSRLETRNLLFKADPRRVRQLLTTLGYEFNIDVFGRAHVIYKLLLETGEVCEVLDITREQLYILLNEKELMSRRIGHKWMITRSSLDDYLEKNRR